MSLLPGIKIPENCVARVREELLQMDEEVKRRRKEREQQALEQRLVEERMHKMEQENKHHLANLFRQKPMLNQSLTQSLVHSQILKQKLSQNALHRTQTGSISQLQRLQSQAQSTLPQPAQNLTMLPFQRNRSQPQQRTHNSWPNNSTNTSTTSQGPLPNINSLTSNLSQFYPQSFLSSFPQLKSQSVPLHQTAQSPNMSSKNPLDEILDLTVSSPSLSPDTSEGRPSLDSLMRHSTTFGDDFHLESLLSQNAPNAQMQQPLLLQQQQQQQHLQTTQQQKHNLLANNHQDLLDFLDLSLSPQMPTQKASPTSSTSSCSSTSSTSSTSNSMISHPLHPTSSSSSVFSSTSSPASLFSNSSTQFSSPYLLPQSDSLSLPNGHCNAITLDVREALNSMLQAGPDRKSVIQFRNQD